MRFKSKEEKEGEGKGGRVTLVSKGREGFRGGGGFRRS